MFALLIIVLVVFVLVYAYAVIARDTTRAVRRRNARKEADRIIRGESANWKDINRLIDILGRPVAKARWAQVKEDDHVRIAKLRSIRDRQQT